MKERSGEIYEVRYLEDTDEFDVRPWGMTVYLGYEEMVNDLEETLKFVKALKTSE